MLLGSRVLICGYAVIFLAADGMESVSSVMVVVSHDRYVGTSSCFGSVLVSTMEVRWDSIVVNGEFE